ncbi:MAG: DivIVA domain-containing protein [Coriobacteriales bacterium]|jgi:cell division initiation protein|nr:DivIVA domain-containing protein [Coriobacteriales bacterium]
MSITAQEIQQVGFGSSRRGYDSQEVDDFLERVAREVDLLNRALAEAKDRLELADQRPSASGAASGIAEDSISKAFIAAQRSADALMDEARREAEKLYRDSEGKARDIVRDSLAEKQRIQNEIDRLRESCEQFRTDYLSLIHHFNADAQKTFPSVDEKAAALGAPAPDVEAQGLFAANDAAVAAPAPAEEPVPERPSYTPKPPVEEAAAVAEETAYYQDIPTAYDAYDDDDDDLDIEEID